MCDPIEFRFLTISFTNLSSFDFLLSLSKFYRVWISNRLLSRFYRAWIFNCHTMVFRAWILNGLYHDFLFHFLSFSIYCHSSLGRRTLSRLQNECLQVTISNYHRVLKPAQGVTFPAQGASSYVPIQRTAHCIHVMPANDTNESVFG